MALLGGLEEMGLSLLAVNVAEFGIWKPRKAAFVVNN